MIRKIAAALGAGALIAASRTAFAIDAVAVEAGGGEQRTNLLRVAIVDKWRRQHDPDPPQWRLAGYWEISLRQGSAAERLRIKIGDLVRLTKLPQG